MKPKATQPYVILISGKQGSGKSSVSRELTSLLASADYVVSIQKFADPLYRIHDAVLNILRGYGIDVPEKDGGLLQWIGTDYGRQSYGQDVWSDCAKAAVNKATAAYFANPGNAKPLVFIFDDCRFRNELRAWGCQDGGYQAFTVRLEADRDTRKARCEGWRINETHVSEIDLDDCSGEFDAVLRTDGPSGSASKTAATIAAAFLDWVAAKRAALDPYAVIKDTAAREVYRSMDILKPGTAGPFSVGLGLGVVLGKSAFEVRPHNYRGVPVLVVATEATAQLICDTLNGVDIDARPAAPPAKPEWQDISLAPWDGTMVWVGHSRSKWVHQASWVDKPGEVDAYNWLKRARCDDNGITYCDPTHFMVIVAVMPEPPK